MPRKEKINNFKSKTGINDNSLEKKIFNSCQLG